MEIQNTTFPPKLSMVNFAIENRDNCTNLGAESNLFGQITSNIAMNFTIGGIIFGIHELFLSFIHFCLFVFGIVHVT